MEIGLNKMRYHAKLTPIRIDGVFVEFVVPRHMLPALVVSNR